MSNPIDEGLVAMKFNNSQFLSGIKSTLDGLSGLKKGLKLDGATKGLDEVGRAAGKFNFGNIGSSIEGVNGKFLAMATVAVTALSRITNAAITTGAQVVKSLTVDPINEGLREYETNLNSIQTILANTQSKGSTLEDVNGALQELNEYADLTIYNFAEMARNIGTFTAAGVDLDTSTNAIKGIANLAAVSGSNSQQASTAMYQLSQALSTGAVKLMDWNSVVNAGMGGELFQENLKETARVHGVAVDQIIEEQGSFRDSLQTGWLTSEILTESLMKMTGDLTDSQLEAMGYTAEQIVEIQKMAETASDAATKVKTVTQLMSTLQEAAGSGWAMTWQLIFGDFEEAKELFTGVNDVLSGMIGAQADARNAMLSDWKELGGRTAIIEAIGNAFQFLMDVLKPIKEAFRQIFPPATGAQLYAISDAIRNFTERLEVSRGTATTLKRIFGGLFAALSIGVSIVKGVAGVLGRMAAELFKGSGEVGNFLAKIGDFLIKLDQSIKKGEGFTAFFEKVGDVAVTAVRFVRDFAAAIFSLFDNVNADEASGGFEKMRERLEPLGVLGRILLSIWENLGPAFSAAWTWFKPLAQGMSDFFGSVGDKIAEGIGNIDYNQLLDTINTGLFAALVLIINRFLSKGINIDPSGGLVGTIKDTFGAVTDTFGAMQAQLKAGTLQKIAVAIALITASVVALSFIDSGKLTMALAAITVMFTQMVVMMAILDKVTMSKGFLKLPALTAGLMALAVALLIMSAAVKVLSTMSWEELAKGLGGLAVMLGILAAAQQVMSTKTKGLVATGVGLIAVAVAIKILASAVKDFSALSWGDMVKGLFGVAATLTTLAIFTRLAAAGKGGIKQAVGLVILAGALKILASVLQDFASMSLGDLAKGLGTLAASLLIISVAMALMKTAIFGAVALTVVAGALVVLAEAMKSMGGMSWDEIGKGLTVLAASLVIIAAALALMTAALPGAAALIVAAGALAILAPVLTTLGAMSWDAIVRGLVALAGTFLVLGVAGLLLTPLVPVLLALGAAIFLLGIGIAAAGAGTLLFAAGLTALAAAGTLNAVAMAAMASVFIGLIPTAFRAIGEGIKAFASVIAEAGPEITNALATLLLSLIEALSKAVPAFLELMTDIMLGLLDVIDTVAPRLIDTLTNLILDLLAAIETLIPEFVTAGLNIIEGILEGIASNIGGIVKAGTDIIVNFINAVAKGLPRIIQAAVNLILAFVNGLANAIRNNQSRTDAAMRNLASAMLSAFGSAFGTASDIGRDILSGIASGLRNGVSVVTGAARDVASSALNAAKDFLGIQSPSKEFMKVGEYSGEGMAIGLAHMMGPVEDSAKSVGQTAVDTLKETLRQMEQDSIGEIDIQPRIRPVLDFTDIDKDSKKLKDLVTPSSFGDIGGGTSLARATAIAQEQARRETEQLSDIPEGIESPVTYVQNNYSPKALSPVEIYRQTNNQLSTVRRGVRNNAYSG